MTLTEKSSSSSTGKRGVKEDYMPSAFTVEWLYKRLALTDEEPAAGTESPLGCGWVSGEMLCFQVGGETKVKRRESGRNGKGEPQASEAQRTRVRGAGGWGDGMSCATSTKFCPRRTGASGACAAEACARVQHTRLAALFL